MANVTVGTSVVSLDLSDYPDQGGTGQVLVMQNLGTGDIYFDMQGDVSASSGVKIAANGFYEITLKGQDVYVIASAAGTDLRYLAVG